MLVAFNATTHLLCESIARNEYEKPANPSPMFNERFVEAMQSLFRGKLIFYLCLHYFIAFRNKTKQTKRDSSADIFVGCQCIGFSCHRGGNSVRVLSQTRIFFCHTSHDSPKTANDINIELWMEKNTYFSSSSFLKMHGIPFKY